MAEVKLKRVLRRETGDAVQQLIDSFSRPISIYDVDNNLLLYNPAAKDRPSPAQTALDGFPIQVDNQPYGFVSGEKGDLIAGLVALLIASEIDKKSLGGETLNLYREINLLYNLAEKLGASPEVQPVAEMALEEAGRLIKTTAGGVLLQRDPTGPFEIVASTGEVVLPALSLDSETGILADIARSGKGEIVNHILGDPRHSPFEAGFHALACAPLNANNHTIGVIALLCKEAVLYTAGDFKLLNALASQAAPAIESALLYERTVREAKAREERLQRQIQELQIELDEAKQKEKVAEITESDYFKNLRSQADSLRKIMGE